MKHRFHFFKNKFARIRGGFFMLLLPLLLLSTAATAQNYRSIFSEAEYYVDSTDSLTPDQVLQQKWSKRENPNFGFIQHTVWLKIDLNKTQGFFDYNYLQAGNVRTHDLAFFEVDDSSNISIIQKENFVIDQLLTIQSLKEARQIIVKTKTHRAPTYLGLKLIKNENALLVNDQSRKVLTWIALILVFITCTASFTYFVIIKNEFYLFYSAQMLLLLLFMTYNSGVSKYYISDQSIGFWVNTAFIFYYGMALPLTLFSRFSNAKKLYSRYIILFAILVLTGTLIIISGFDLNSTVVVFSGVLQLTLMIFLIFHWKVLFRLKHKFFFFLFFFSVVLFYGKAVDQYGFLPDNWITQLLFEIVIISEVIFWVIYIIQLIRREKKEQLAMEFSLVETKQQAKYALIQGQEKERDRFGKELHDHVGATLSAVRLLIQINPKETKGHLDDINDDLVSISSDYKSPELNEHGLKKELERHIQIISQSKNVKVHLEYNSTLIDELDAEGLLHVYRSIQEAINNAVKHGKATEIIVQLMDSEGQLLIYVEDNGQGMEAEAKEGLGFSNIRTRLDRYGLQFDIRSEKNVGTQLQMQLSIN
ncbi:MAG: hypothetical protein JXR07_08795 [Reichenbachiella sp.]